jgi:hypothetical protein
MATAGPASRFGASATGASGGPVKIASGLSALLQAARRSVTPAKAKAPRLAGLDPARFLARLSVFIVIPAPLQTVPYR